MTGEQHPEDAPTDVWPPSFPHAAIDELLDQMELAQEAAPELVGQLLELIADEARRLRATVLRLSVARLAAAEKEANLILAQAREYAETLRGVALESLDARLDEADRLTAAVRHATRISHRTSGQAHERPAEG